jgi:hypothetical protein
LIGPSTSPSLWRSNFLSLLPRYGALLDVASIPPHLWSFSLSHNGWFRAYSLLNRIGNTRWLRTEEDLKDSQWIVLFKGFLREGGGGDDDGHALVDMRTDLTCSVIEGLPLITMPWYVDEVGVRCEYTQWEGESEDGGANVMQFQDTLQTYHRGTHTHGAGSWNMFLC